jgi:hypothetical protein
MGGLPASVLFGVEFTAFLHDRIRPRSCRNALGLHLGEAPHDGVG